MSLGTWLADIIKGIEDFFNRITPKAKEAIHWGVVITQALKTTEDFGGDVFDKIFPGVPAAVNEAVRAKLPEILINLKLAEDCSNQTDEAEFIKCAALTFQSVVGDFRNDFADALAVQITIAASDGDISWTEGKTLVKWYYDHKYKVDPVVK